MELVSALLDPRFKSLEFVKITNKLTAKDVLKNLYNNEKLLENEHKSLEECEDSENNNEIDN
ncbi:12013_t:CDS:2, partial [Dentiscutata heterogama]